jgi:glycosyltransferase involved in cell wall biosynthesis
MPAVEAMKCGCPVVTSNSGSLPEIVGKGGILVKVFDVKDYAESIKEILENKKLAADLRRKGLKNAERFSWEKSAKKTIEVYESLFT